MPTANIFTGGPIRSSDVSAVTIDGQGKSCVVAVTGNETAAATVKGPKVCAMLFIFNGQLWLVSGPRSIVAQKLTAAHNQSTEQRCRADDEMC